MSCVGSEMDADGTFELVVGVIQQPPATPRPLSYESTQIIAHIAFTIYFIIRLIRLSTLRLARSIYSMHLNGLLDALIFFVLTHKPLLLVSILPDLCPVPVPVPLHAAFVSLHCHVDGRPQNHC